MVKVYRVWWNDRITRRQATDLEREHREQREQG